MSGVRIWYIAIASSISDWKALVFGSIIGFSFVYIVRKGLYRNDYELS